MGVREGWAGVREGRVGVRAEEGAGGSYTARREECGKKWKAREVYLVRDTAQGSRSRFETRKFPHREWNTGRVVVHRA